MNHVVLRCIVAAAILLLAIGQPSPAQERREVPDFRIYGEAATVRDRERIDALLEQYKRAWGQQDVETLSQLHADDVEWINAYARMFRGVADLTEFLRNRLFPAFDPEVSAHEAENMKMISLRYIGSDAAVAHLYTDGNRGNSRNATEVQRRTHLHLVLENRYGAWRIVHTAIMDAR